MLNLIRAEWLKLSRRPLSRVLLAIFLALLLGQIAAQFVFVGILGERDGTVGFQLDEMRRRLTFPGVFGAALNHVNGLGGIFAVIFTAGAMGSEYSWGTLRTQLARDPARGRYLTAKIVALLLMLTLAMAITLVVAIVTALLVGTLRGELGTLSAGDVAQLPLAMLRALYVLLPYVLLTLCFTIMGRSLLVGMAGGLLYLVFEAGFGTLALLQLLGGLWGQIYNLTIGQNINTLALMNSHAFGLRPESATALDLATLPSPLQATVVIAIYCVLFFASAIYFLRSRDVGGPG